VALQVVPGSTGALASGAEGVIAQPASASVRAVAAAATVATRCAALVNAIIDFLHKKQRGAQRKVR
jgi:hypothetical protein